MSPPDAVLPTLSKTVQLTLDTLYSVQEQPATFMYMCFCSGNPHRATANSRAILVLKSTFSDQFLPIKVQVQCRHWEAALEASRKRYTIAVLVI